MAAYDDDIPWCMSLDRKDTINLLKALRTSRKHSETDSALDNLMKDSLSEGKYRINLNFISHFASFFKINIPCICDNFLNGYKDYIFNVKSISGGGAVGVVRLVEDRKTNNIYILKQIPRAIAPPYLSLRVREYNAELANICPTLKYTQWEEGDKIKRFNLTAGGDDYSNQTVLHLILNKILKTNPNYVYQYDSFYCETGGYNIMELAEENDLSDFLTRYKESINDDLLVDIFRQILEPLSILKQPQFGFVHADLKTRNVFVSMGKNNRPIYKLADFDKSSITWNGIRFYNNTIDYRAFDIPFKMKTNSYGIDYYSMDMSDRSYSVISKIEKVAINTYTMHNPNGFYPNHDVYTFFFSLMIEPVVWNYLNDNKNSEIWKMWREMWIYEHDFEKVNKYIRRMQNKLNVAATPNKPPILKQMRSISNINRVFVELEVSLRVNLPMYDYFNYIHPKSFYEISNEPLGSLTISNDMHICTTKCSSGKCNTNRYSKMGFTGKTIYDWDYC